MNRGTFKFCMGVRETTFIVTWDFLLNLFFLLTPKSSARQEILCICYSHFLAPHNSYTAWKVSRYGVFSGPNTGKYRPENIPYLDTFHAVRPWHTNKFHIEKPTTFCFSFWTCHWDFGLCEFHLVEIFHLVDIRSVFCLYFHSGLEFFS